MAMIITETAPPLSARNRRVFSGIIVWLRKVVSMVFSGVSMETQAAAREMAFAADTAGLLNFRQRTMLTMAIVSEVNV